MNKQTKAEKLKLLEEKKRLIYCLPHLYGMKFYPWMRQYFDSTNKTSLICASNQVGKSTIQHRKVVDWATNKDKWKILWPHISQPRQFWLLYPSSYVATIEFEKKIKVESMPRDEFKNHPIYGWEADYRAKYIQAIHFNSGVSVFFKTYSQDPQDLQSGTCFIHGTIVFTNRGEIPIEQITTNDFVLSAAGWKRVTSIYERKAEVLTRTFSNGKTITATPDHLFWTTVGWVQFGSLTSLHKCITLPECRLTKKLFYLTAKLTSASHRTKIYAERTISKIKTAVFTMLQYGRRTTIERYPKIAAYTTKILIRLITLLKTYSLSQEQSTQGSTNLRNGRKEGFGSLVVLLAKKFLKPEALKTLLEGFALRIAEGSRIPKSLNVKDALKSFYLEKTLGECTVLNCVQTEQRGTVNVYDIAVQDSKSFFANGLLVHNCDAIFFDEELPEELVPELQARLFASDGYFNGVFTPTLGQEYWREAIEVKGPKERFKDALKIQVSMYDCLKYEDGTPSFWTVDRIEKIKAQCKSEAEIQRRVYGKFVLDSGLKYQAFNAEKNLIDPFPIPHDWPIYIGVDSGSGGKFNHPSAVSFVAMKPDFTYGVVFKGQRFDGYQMTSSDLVMIVREMKKEFEGRVANVFYDYSNVDIFNIASQMGETWIPAEKSHLIGEQIINVGFKNNMIQIFNIDELAPLVGELKSLKLTTPKNQAHDDAIDSFRYSVSKIPWDWSNISGKPATDITHEKTEHELRREFISSEDIIDQESINGEIEMYNDLLGDFYY